MLLSVEDRCLLFGGVILFHTAFKDPVLPMILSGLTMNFILYEKDDGLAIARLCICRVNFQMNVEVIALNSNKRHCQSN